MMCWNNSIRHMFRFWTKIKVTKLIVLLVSYSRVILCSHLHFFVFFSTPYIPMICIIICPLSIRTYQMYAIKYRHTLWQWWSTDKVSNLHKTVTPSVKLTIWKNYKIQDNNNSSIHPGIRTKFPEMSLSPISWPLRFCSHNFLNSVQRKGEHFYRWAIFVYIGQH